MVAERKAGGAARAAIRRAALALGLAVGVISPVVATSGCLETRELPQSSAEENPCTACHGSSSRTGPRENQPAPPNDISGNTDVASPGVGAHQIHLGASTTHRVVACNDCHVVPKSVASPGHADSPGPAKFTPSDLAKQGGRSPAFDTATMTCSGTYCHREATPKWTAPRDEKEACGTCHALPPAAPHPQDDQCFRCHGDVIDAKRNFVAPSKHVDGHVDFAISCHACHGSEASNAPPNDLAGSTSKSEIGVGAHQAHLTGGKSSRPLECSECHTVPTPSSLVQPGHLDGTAHAPVTFGALAKTGDRDPSWDRTDRRCSAAYCHGPLSKDAESPRWTMEDGPATCTTCHGHPPAAPHPQDPQCFRCHPDVAAEDGTIKNRALHVDGIVEYTLPTNCHGCHGSPASDAPPNDLAGNTATTFTGVGAHQTHLQGKGTARKVTCGECHVVPATILQPGHLDAPAPAKLTFSGTAALYAAAPAFDGAKCTNTYCHGVTFVAGQPSGGTLTEPNWTKVDGSQVVCGSCHGLPPPPPLHPETKEGCETCHTNMAPGFVFKDPSLHVDGVIQ